MPVVLPTAPTPVITATGFRVESQVAGGASTAATGPAAGLVTWSSLGHAVLTAAGWAALVTQASGYINGLPSLRPEAQFRMHGPAGVYSVENADLATQQAAIVAILKAAANVSGSAA